MEFIINWKTNDPNQSVPLFLKGITFPPGVKVVSSYHYIGKPEGIVVLDTNDPALINAMLTTLPPGVFTVEVNAVVDDAASKKAFQQHTQHGHA
jgi:hypothetical protein